MEARALSLRGLLESVKNGEIVLPDFQRSFIWEPEDVRELISSVIGNYFIGSMLMMNCSRDESPFALRLIEGVEEINPNVKIQSLVKILLDGQQRTTALFYALHELNIPLKGRKSPHRFFINLEKALNEEWDEAVEIVSIGDKKRYKKLSSDTNLFIPLSLFKDIGELGKRYRDHENFSKIIEFANKFLNYQIHVVELPNNTNLNKIVEIFERINRTGEPLSIFDLVTARLYKYGIKLRNLLENADKKYEFIKDKKVPPEFILKVIALIRGKEPKRKNLLELSPDNFEKDWKEACRFLENAYKRLTDLKNGYGVLDFKKWIPYSTMIVPLAALLHFIEKEKLDNEFAYNKINIWYWSSVFLNRYDQAVDTTSWEDFKDVRDWIKENKVPDFIQKININKIDLDIDRQSSATYRGIINLITLKGALDFKTGQPPQFNLEKVQDDHIFPKSIFKEDKIANRTIITTNQSKINKKPSEYFKERIKELGEEKVKFILSTHLIPPEALQALLNDDLEIFMKLRKKAFLNEIKEKITLIT